MDDLQQVILDEVRATRSELRAHIVDEEAKFAHVRKDIIDLKTDVALQKQRAGIINGALAAIISALTAWFVSVFGK